MLDWLASLDGYVEAAFSYLINLIESLVMAVGFLVSSAAFASSLVSFMPPIIGTAIVVFLAIFIVKFLIGR